MLPRGSGSPLARERGRKDRTMNPVLVLLTILILGGIQDGPDPVDPVA
jgi:hypothetical protein